MKIIFSLLGVIVMKINERIRQIGHIQGLSQEEIAMQLDISANGGGNIDHGDVDIKLSISKLEQISKLFGIDVADLLTLTVKNTFNVISDSGTQNINDSGTRNTGILNHFDIYNSNSDELVELKHEIEKLKLIIDNLQNTVTMQHDEITYLKSIIELVKAK